MLGRGVRRLSRERKQAAPRPNRSDINGWLGITEFDQDINDYVRQGFYGLTTIGAPIPGRSHTAAFGNVDSERKPLTGASAYTLTFDTGHLPPVSEFWELPLYDDDGYFTDNELDRYSVNSFMLERGELHVEDGTVTIYIQHHRPSDPLQAQNWLPAPERKLPLGLPLLRPDGQLAGLELRHARHYPGRTSVTAATD